MLAVLTLLTAGCSNSTDGAAATQPAAAPWDPCTQISDSLIARAGLDPATKDPNAAGAQYEGWKTCSWKPVGYDPSGTTGYYVILMSTDTRSISDVRKDPGETHLTDVMVGSRPAVESQYGHDNGASYTCDITFTTKDNGIVNMSIDGQILTKFTSPVCDVARNTATALLSALPT
jgi:hypothetical protein